MNLENVTIGIVTADSIENLSELDGMIVNHLIANPAKYDFQYFNIACPDVVSRAGACNIPKLVKQNPADVYVITGARPETTKVLGKLGVTAVYIGGVI